MTSDLRRARVAKAREAIALRLRGEQWQAIADRLGYSGPGAAYNAAWREFDPDYRRRKADPEAPFLTDSGESRLSQSDPSPKFESPQIETATCSKCGETKPTWEFYDDPSKASGRRSSCRACDLRAKAESYARKTGSLDGRQPISATHRCEKKSGKKRGSA